MVTETRYLRATTHTINTITGFELATTETSPYNYIEETADLSKTGSEWGIKVYKVDVNGNRTLLSGADPVAVVQRMSEGGGIQGAPWTPPQTALVGTDAIQIEVYQRFYDGSWLAWTLLVSGSYSSWITEQLDAGQLDAVEWWVRYYTYLEYKTSGPPSGRKTIARFYFGQFVTNNSKIDYFSYTPLTGETRFFRSDYHDINCEVNRQFKTTQSPNSDILTITKEIGGITYWGIRVFKRDAYGVETEITSGTPVATVGRSTDGQGYQSANYTPPETILDDCDAIVIKVYAKFSFDPWQLLDTWVTERLVASQLSAEQWEVIYWTQRVTLELIVYASFNFGNITYNSRINDFTWLEGVSCDLGDVCPLFEQIANQDGLTCVSVG